MTGAVHFTTSVSEDGAFFYTGPFVHAVLATRTQVTSLNADWNTYGAYVLLGDPESVGVTKAYVGQSEQMVSRMKRPDHQAKKFWTRALLIQSPLREAFSTADIGFLEGRLIEDLSTSAELDLTANKKASRDESVSLAQRQYLEHQVLPTVKAILSQQVPGLSFGTRTAGLPHPQENSLGKTPTSDLPDTTEQDEPTSVTETATRSAGRSSDPGKSVSNQSPAGVSDDSRPAATPNTSPGAIGIPAGPSKNWDTSALFRAQKSHRFVAVPDMLAERGTGPNFSLSTDRLAGHEILVYLDRLTQADPETGLASSEVVGCAARTGLPIDTVCDADERLITAGLLTARVPRDRSQPALLDTAPARRVTTIPIPAVAIWPSTAPDAPARWAGEDAGLAVRALLATIHAAERNWFLKRREQPVRSATVAYDAGLSVADYLRGLDLLLPEPAPGDGCSVGHTNGWLTVIPGPHTSSETWLHVEVDWSALPAHVDHSVELLEAAAWQDHLRRAPDMRRR